MRLGNNKPRGGFTLIQIVVALAVIAILAATAMPSYTEAMRKGKRTEGRAALYALLLQQERFFSQRNTYITFSIGSTSEDEKQFKWFSGNNPATSAYETKAEACTNDTIENCVRLIAKPGTANVDARFEDPVCGELSLSSNGEKSANSPECWR
jgi:type IV pilus assembly protein PilE